MSNIKVAVRCRGRNSQEVKSKSPIVLELANDNFSSTEPFITINQPTSTTTFQNSFSELTNNQKKTYTFDQIYGSQADQSLIYSHLANPLLKDFLDGINVTILAYGQTGTGKTYTMCGMDQKCKDIDTNNEYIGIIPRLLCDLFDNLSSDDDYMIKISYLEIYNEELIDLLSNSNKKLRIHEKQSNDKKFKHISVQNLSEYCINNSQEGLKFLKLGLNKKKTASTNLNETSSRSHTIFSIQLYKKDHVDTSIYRVSKMNLVDLAGSENISRSGSVVKEAGGINQSLLTLGRVINTLNDKVKSKQHIPYRESKLTYLLQDSLGGKTKTTLIATVSPAQINLVETCSTLDYASKAKNIKNLPQNGHDSELILKKTLVKNISQELAQMNMDLIASRNKNGIYLDPENYRLLMSDYESLKTQLKENKLKTESVTNKLLQTENTKKDYKTRLEQCSLENQAITQKHDKLIVDHEDTLSKLEQRDLMIKSLNEQLGKILEKSSTSASMLVDLLSDHLNSSIILLNNTLQLNNENNVSKLKNFQKDLGIKLKSYKEEIVSSIETYQSKINTLVNNDIQEVISTFQDNFKILTDFHHDFYDNSQNLLLDFKIINEKFSGYLKENYLDDLENKLSSSLKNILNIQLSPLVSKFEKFLSNEIESSMQSIISDYQESINMEVTQERGNLLKMEQNWHDQISNIAPSFENQFIQQKKVFETSQNTISHLKLSNINNFEYSEEIQVKEPPNISHLGSLASDFSSTTNLLNSNLTQINTKLSSLQQFDVKNAFKVSPFKEKTVSLSIPNRHGIKNKSPSKIPTLQRSKTDLDYPGESKKRKILQSLNNYV